MTAAAGSPVDGATSEMLAVLRARRGEPPVATRDASTIVLLRDGAGGTGGLEAYLLRRVASMAFAPRMHVFPGGRVDPADSAAHTGWFGVAPEEWAGVLSADAALAQGLVCAAVRETFEESGVLLAGAAPDEVADVSSPDWEADRLALIERRESLSGLLTRRGLALRADLLRPWAHWITPEIEPRRYDTRFFVAGLPQAQSTRDVGGESDATMWLTPDEAIELHERGELDMLPPTISTLRELAQYATVEDVLVAAAARDIAPVLPRLVLTDDGQMELLLPHQEGYAS
jgi:8-oxo-dGTP pyrophosphatase MutT (NUDIX family)